MSMSTQDKVKDILSLFPMQGELKGIKINTQGHINSTFISLFEENGREQRYTHQMINSSVFPHPDQVMSNILLVTEHIREKVKGMEDEDRRTLRVIKAKDGKPYAIDSDGMYWRTYTFIDGVKSYDRVDNEEIAYNLGLGIGTFQHQLSDFDSSKLYTVIPHFHDMAMRFQQLRDAIKADSKGRAGSVSKELEFLFDNENRLSVISNSYYKNLLPSRVTHNDTKINNVLFSERTGKALAVIDLDTIMPGTILFDTGDMIRTACSTADEDEKDTSLMEFSIPYYKALYEGYLDASSSFITEKERECIKESGRTITAIMAVRFLTDYINGDTYYKTAYPEHNLVRTRTQLKLIESMDKQWEDF